MTIYQLKPRFQQLLRPLARQLARSGTTANQVTLAACAGSMAIGVLVAAAASLRWPFLILPVWLIVRMALNALDGMLAREFKDWGEMIEGHGGMLDRLDSVIFAAPVFFHLTRYFFSA